MGSSFDKYDVGEGGEGLGFVFRAVGRLAFARVVFFFLVFVVLVDFVLLVDFVVVDFFFAFAPLGRRATERFFVLRLPLFFAML
jgi:hypothetical protein